MTSAQQRQHDTAIAKLVEYGRGLPFDTFCAAMLHVIEDRADADDTTLQALGSQLERASDMRKRGLPITYGMVDDMRAAGAL